MNILMTVVIFIGFMFFLKKFIRQENAARDAMSNRHILLLDHRDEKVRAAAAYALGFSQYLDAIPSLIKVVLQDRDATVRESARKSLYQMQNIVKTVAFGAQRHDQALLNPEASEQLLSFPELQQIEIQADFCDLALVERFCRYLQTAYKPDLLRKQVGVTISGNPLVFSPEVFAVLGWCRSVDIMLETVIFGNLKGSRFAFPQSLTNPNFTPLTLPCNHLRRVLIDTEHADFHLLERFLTYMLAYLGQAYLDGVEVTLYGDPTRLHPNLHNNIRNLFPHVTVYEATQLIGVTAEQKQQ